MNDLGSLLFWILLIALGVFLFWFFVFKVKHLRTPNVYCIDGGVKTGKSVLTVKLAVVQYRKNCLKVFIANLIIRSINIFRKLFRKPKKSLKEKPMLYSNMPLYKVKYNVFTLDIIYFKVRLPYLSVCIIDEASLLADAMLGFNNSKGQKERFDEVNEKLTLFIKLYGHITHNGSLFYNSQQIVDLHFSFKRCTSTYLFISKNRKFPFFCLLDTREMVHTEDNDSINVYNQDLDVDSKPLFLSKRWYKYYDRFYLDVLVKDLPVYVNYLVKRVSPFNKQELKEIVTLGNYKLIRDYNEKKKVVLKDEKKQS